MEGAGREGTGRANMKRSGALGVPEWVNEGGFRILKVEIDSLDSFGLLIAGMLQFLVVFMLYQIIYFNKPLNTCKHCSNFVFCGKVS